MLPAVNSKRIFSEVLSLEAWQAPTDQVGLLSLHADVVFKQGRIGGENESKIRFRLGIKRAELIVVIPEVEPVKAVRTSISRDTFTVEGIKSTKLTFDSSLSGSSNLGLEIGEGRLGGKAQITAAASANMKTERSYEQKSVLQNMEVVQSRTPDDDCKWDMISGIGEILLGRPWNGATEPRMVLRDTRADPTKGIPPVVNIIVRCLREDLDIDRIEIKDEDVWSLVSAKIGLRNNIIAAEAYIRNRLAGEGLGDRDISDPYCSINLAYVPVETEEY